MTFCKLCFKAIPAYLSFSLHIQKHAVSIRSLRCQQTHVPDPTIFGYFSTFHGVTVVDMDECCLRNKKSFKQI